MCMCGIVGAEVPVVHPTPVVPTTCLTFSYRLTKLLDVASSGRNPIQGDLLTTLSQRMSAWRLGVTIDPKKPLRRQQRPIPVVALPSVFHDSLRGLCNMAVRPTRYFLRYTLLLTSNCRG